MFATTGIIQDNAVCVQDCVLEQYNGRKVIITVLDEEKIFDTIPNEQLFDLSETMILKNKKAYQELAK